MDTLFSFLSSFFDRLGVWVVVQPNEGAVRIRSVPWREQRVTDHGPGTVWKLPFFDRVLKAEIKRRTIDLTNVSVETKDGVPYLLSVTLSYHIHNLRRALLECEHFDTSLCVDAQRVVTNWANENLAPLSAAALEVSCFSAIRSSGFRWGCTIEEVGVNSIAKHRVYRLMVDNQ